MWRNGMSRRLAYFRLSEKSDYFIAKFSRWLKRSKEIASKHDNLIRTEMFVQEGFDIYELPIVIKKISDIHFFCNAKNVDNFPATLCISQPFKEHKSEEHCNALQNRKQKICIDADNIPILFAQEVNISNILNVEQIFKETVNSISEEKIKALLLDSAIHMDINSRMALECLKKIINMERKHRKLMRASKFIPNRHMMLRQLSEIIITSQDSGVILKALSIIIKDKFLPPNNSYKDILTNEALIRSTNGDFSIQQLIDIIKILSIFGDAKYQDAIDYFWTGIVIKQEDITAHHLVPLFKLLSYMKRSRIRVQILLEKKLIKNYHKLSAPQMTDILNIFQKYSKSSVVMKCASKWATMHLLSISKYDFLEFVESLTTAKFINFTLEKAIEKALDMKKMKSNDHSLMSAVAVYCSTVHLRNICICNRVVKYLEKHSKYLPLDSSVEMIVALGNLNFELQSKDDFWHAFEQTLDNQFFYLEQEKVMQVLLSCAYINKYFPKCMQKIFSPGFLDNLESQGDTAMAQSLRNQLYVLDTAMTLECTTYSGPLLFRSNQLDPVVIDMQITRTISRIHSQLIKLAGDSEKLSTHVTLSNLSTTPLYIIDALIHKQSKYTRALELDLIKEKNENTAVIVLLPHHYCWGSCKLIGEQAMRIRHLRKLGFRVMLLDFNNLCLTYGKVHELAKYLNRAFKTAYEAL